MPTRELRAVHWAKPNHSGLSPLLTAHIAPPICDVSTSSQSPAPSPYPPEHFWLSTWPLPLMMSALPLVTRHQALIHLSTLGCPCDTLSLDDISTCCWSLRPQVLIYLSTSDCSCDPSLLMMSASNWASALINLSSFGCTCGPCPLMMSALLTGHQDSTPCPPEHFWQFNGASPTTWPPHHFWLPCGPSP